MPAKYSEPSRGPTSTSSWVSKSISRRELLVKRSSGYLVRDSKLYRKCGDRMPQLAVMEKKRRYELLEHAHEQCDHVWWPNLWSDIEWRSRTCPVALKHHLFDFYPVNLNTVKMPKSTDGSEYILHAHEGLP
ncbi:hypothetical protein BD410DRAFT_808140 [Rickenella mellea]|uniref:Uncharacterized protein n=1 Tax=Rickenella mellea TaxID=50990 RepID=A0A4Y7PLS2_9AGAM|nr:hypothetical protein BD410DRAFT_808140 [Rickenella mellea]